MTDEQKGTEDQKPGLTIGLGEGFVELTHEEARDLRIVCQTPGWGVFRGILKEMMNGATVILRDRNKTIEDLRFCQGQADACITLARIVEDEVPQWYSEGVENA